MFSLRQSNVEPPITSENKNPICIQLITNKDLSLFLTFISYKIITLANSKRDAWNDDPPSYDSIDFSKSELPTYDDIRNL